MLPIKTKLFKFKRISSNRKRLDDLFRAGKKVKTKQTMSANCERMSCVVKVPDLTQHLWYTTETQN